MSAVHKYKLGCRRDNDDNRDMVFSAPMTTTYILPRSVDLRDKMPPIYDQYDTNSCTANSTCAQLWYMHYCDECDECDAPKECQPSRLFEYYNARKISKTHHVDEGATIRDSIKCLGKYGHCSETAWPFFIENICVEPPKIVYEKARKTMVDGMTYHRIDRRDPLIRLALSQNRPVNFGTMIHKSFYDAKYPPYIAQVPDRYEQRDGGHAMLIVGYNDDTRLFIVRNSWGDTWADKGYFYMPYDYIYDCSTCFDFWVLDTLPKHIDLCARRKSSTSSMIHNKSTEQSTEQVPDIAQNAESEPIAEPEPVTEPSADNTINN